MLAGGVTLSPTFKGVGLGKGAQREEVPCPAHSHLANLTLTP